MFLEVNLCFHKFANISCGKEEKSRPPYGCVLLDYDFFSQSPTVLWLRAGVIMKGLGINLVIMTKMSKMMYVIVKSPVHSLVRIICGEVEHDRRRR